MPLSPLPPVEPAAVTPGRELCYECGGDRRCQTCDGTGRLDDERCPMCHGGRWCIVCRGVGLLPEGARAALG